MGARSAKQLRVRTRAQDSVAMLYDRIMDRSIELVGRLVKDAEEGTLASRPQPEGDASYYSSVDEADFRLDWTRDAEVLCRWVHTTPGKCLCDLKGSRVSFMDAQVIGRQGGERPGTLIRLGGSFCDVATGKDALRVRSVQLDGGKMSPLCRLCRELGLGIGDLLE